MLSIVCNIPDIWSKIELYADNGKWREAEGCSFIHLISLYVTLFSRGDRFLRTVKSLCVM